MGDNLWQSITKKCQNGCDLVKIGYPRALLYYKYFPLWNTFLDQLGAEIVLSNPTSKKTVNIGTVYADNELCLPVKVFYGHLMDLKNRVDAIFVPRVVSVIKKEYTCPKFLGLPDMANAVDEDIPTIIDSNIDMYSGWRSYMSGVMELGGLFTKSKLKILSAYQSGVTALKEYHHEMLAGKTPAEVLENKVYRAADPKLKIGLAGHPYNIYDPYISMNLIKRLKGMGAEVVTAEMLPESVIELETSRLPKDLFWTYEKEVVGTVFHWANNRNVDGIIYVLSFACGPDSLVQVLLEHELKKSSIPMMPLVIDEHSAEAGMITRVEAFVDMLSRKKVIGRC